MYSTGRALLGWPSCRMIHHIWCPSRVYWPRKNRTRRSKPKPKAHTENIQKLSHIVASSNDQLWIGISKRGFVARVSEVRRKNVWPVVGLFYIHIYIYWNTMQIWRGFSDRFVICKSVCCLIEVERSSYWSKAMLRQCDEFDCDLYGISLWQISSPCISEDLQMWCHIFDLVFKAYAKRIIVIAGPVVYSLMRKAIK